MTFSYRRDVDGLRAIAIIFVVLFHYGFAFAGNGYLGVDIFFVISGFLITSIIYREMSGGNFSYAKFYSRRFRRILPALMVVIVVTTVVAYLVLPPYELKRYAATAIGALTGTSNVVLYMFVDYFAPSAERQLLLMTWSLGVEEQFYVFFPPLLALIVARARRVTLPVLAALTLTSFVAAVVMNGYRPDAAFYLIPFRAWELGAGALLAIIGVTGWQERLPVPVHEAASAGAIVLLGFTVVAPQSVGPILLNLAAVLATILLIVSQKSVVNRYVLSSRLFVGIGLVSYSWYLWHWLPISLINVLDVEVGQGMRFVLIGVSLMAGVISYDLVETPFRRAPADHRVVVRRYAIATVLAVVPLAIIVVSAGLYRFASPAMQRAERDVRGASGNPCIAPYGASSLNRSTGCLPLGTRPALLLVGDSHANALVAGVRSLAESRSLAFYQATKSSCPPLSGYSRYMPAHPSHDRDCAAFMNEVLKLIEAHPEIRTVVLAGYWAASFDEADSGGRYVSAGSDGRNVSVAESQRNLAKGLDQMVRAVDALGRQVVLVQDVPRFKVDPYAAALADIKPIRGAIANLLTGSMVQPGSERLLATSLIRDGARPIVADVARRHAGVRLVDPYGELCNAAGCLFRTGGDVLYADTQHLSNAGARYVMGRVSASIQ